MSFEINLRKALASILPSDGSHLAMLSWPKEAHRPRNWGRTLTNSQWGTEASIQQATRKQILPQTSRVVLKACQALRLLQPRPTPWSQGERLSQRSQQSQTHHPEIRNVCFQLLCFEVIFFFLHSNREPIHLGQMRHYCITAWKLSSSYTLG